MFPSVLLKAVKQEQDCLENIDVGGFWLVFLGVFSFF